MVDHLDAFHGPLHLLEVQQVADYQIHTFTMVREEITASARQVVEHPHLMPLLKQQVDEMRAYEARSSGHETTHGAPADRPPPLDRCAPTWSGVCYRGPLSEPSPKGSSITFTLMWTGVPPNLTWTAGGSWSTRCSRR